MQVTYVVVVGLMTYILGAVTKTFVDQVPNRYIPMQNLLIGLISAGICVYAKIETDVLQAIVLCVSASAGAGGLHDLTNTNNYK